MDVLDRADLPFPHSLPEFQRLFPDDAACAAYLEKARWGDGFACPHCGTAGEPLDKRELNQLIEACVAPHVRAFVLVCVHTGARARQVYNLTWDRVDLWRGLVCFPPSRPRSKKRSVIIPANATLWAELRSLRTVSKSPWVIEHRGHQVSSIKTGFKAAVRRAGIAPCTVHDLRRTCASLPYSLAA